MFLPLDVKPPLPLTTTASSVKTEVKNEVKAEVKTEVKTEELPAPPVSGAPTVRGVPLAGVNKEEDYDSSATVRNQTHFRVAHAFFTFFVHFR